MKPLKDALKDFKTDKNAAAEVAAALFTQKVLAPAVWDKAPEPDGNGNVVFPPGTNVSLMVMETTDGKTWFPFFTSQEAKDVFDKDAQCLVLTFEQLMQFVHMAGEDVSGLLFDAGTLDTVLDRQFLLSLEKVRNQNMSVNQLRKGDTVTVKEPGDSGKALEEALAREAAVHPEISRLYLFQRLMPDHSVHWLVIAGMSPRNPELFRPLAKAAGKNALGMDLEFLFDDASIGKKIAEAHEPFYTKPLN